MVCVFMLKNNIYSFDNFKFFKSIYKRRKAHGTHKTNEILFLTIGDGSHH